MGKRLILPFVLALVIAAPCSLWTAIWGHVAAPTTQAAPTTLYTDVQAQVFATRLDTAGFGTGQHQRGVSASTVLLQVGIDLSRLPLLGRNVGNCFDISSYALSPGYALQVDDNACFGLGLQVVKR